MSVNVTVTLSDEEYAEALKQALHKGLTIAQYVKRFPIGSDEFENRYAFLKQKALEQPIEIPFTVMSLFQDWDHIERGIRLSLGRNFYHLVKRREFLPVVPAGKNSSNVQLYIVKEKSHEL